MACLAQCWLIQCWLIFGDVVFSPRLNVFGSLMSQPYLETVDSVGRADAVVAEESWRRYLMRNDSIMVDTCTVRGIARVVIYKSELLKVGTPT